MVESQRGALFTEATPLNTDPVQGRPGLLLVPGAKVASYWDGALHSRLKRAPLERFLRSHKRHCDLKTSDAITESVVRACLIIIEPVVPHRGRDWRSLLHPGYFDALGEVVSRMSQALSELIQERKLWRVASLIGVARLLTPNLGVDMAAAAAAAAVAPTLSQQRPAMFEESVGLHAAAAVSSGTDEDLNEARALVLRGFAGIAECGAPNLMCAPHGITIWTEPPSNH